jgi:peptidoglycan/LPS O-acetylase OafA/YrhL
MSVSPITHSLSNPAQLKPRIRYASLDTWRGVACLMVLVFHAAYYQFAAFHEKPIEGGFEALGKLLFTGIGFLWMGVPVFFVISGYCITATCQSPRTRAAGVRSFFYRRYHRIFPPFWSIVGLTVLAIVIATMLGGKWLYVDTGHPIPYPSSLQISQWIGNLTLTESWRYLVAGAKQEYFLKPAWSLCYEEQFYLVCGALLFFFPGRFFRGVAVITALVALLGVLCQSLHWVTAGFFFDGRWFLFAGGILVYWLIHAANLNVRRILTQVLILTSVLTVGAWILPRSQAVIRLSPGIMEASFALWFTTALVLLHKHDERIYTSRLLAPITWCGTMCYSVYLVHWPIVKPISNAMWNAGVTSWTGTLLLTIPVCTAVSLLLARLFFVIVESRFLNTPAVVPVPVSPEPRRQAAGSGVMDPSTPVLP